MPGFVDSILSSPRVLRRVANTVTEGQPRLLLVDHPPHILHELGKSGSRDRRRGLGVQKKKKKMRERVEILCSTQWPTLLSLVFDLGDLGDLTS